MVFLYEITEGKIDLVKLTNTLAQKKKDIKEIVLLFSFLFCFVLKTYQAC